MDKHCKGCAQHHSAGRNIPPAHMKKFNNWCCAKGSKADVGWCKTHNAKQVKETK